jgi:two-component system cell cycle sensor histidine kinase/response regulator CckA
VKLKRLLVEAVALGLSGSSTGHTLDIDPELWPVDADEGQLIQLFHNLILNAQQAMGDGGVVSVRGLNLVEPEPRWQAGVLVRPGPYVGISVGDRGSGISRENLQRIFEPYFTTKAGGAGLGLATSHSIVVKHGGYMTVDSEVGRGTTMHVCLPASSSTLEDQPEPVEAAQAGKGRVLVLDDEEPIRTLATGMLNLLGYEVTTASTGSATIEQYIAARREGRPFDIVMLDLTIPGDVGGKDILHKLRQIDPGINAVVFSGYADDAVMATYRDYGFKAVLPKPFTVQELSRALQDVAHAHS